MNKETIKPKMIYGSFEEWEDKRISFLKILLKEIKEIELTKHISHQPYFNSIYKHLSHLTNNEHLEWCEIVSTNISVSIEAVLYGFLNSEVIYLCPENIVKDIIDDVIIWQFGGDETENPNSYFKDIVEIKIFID
tara:strand:- start:315 stop:719 length:405 start_codon:yes stop_codon:yes gene_type:complete